MRCDLTPAWKNLQHHAQGFAGFDLRTAFATDAHRADALSQTAPYVFADLSKNHTDAATEAAAAAKAQQEAAAQEILKQPEVKPIVGNVGEKPAFLSQMEWNMLKGVAQQNANPDKELTRLVNFVRFTKQLELWQALPEQTDAATIAEEQRFMDFTLPDLRAE